MRHISSILTATMLLWGLTACTGTPEPIDTGGNTDTGIADDDNDGWTIADGDCDDGDASVHPGAREVCGGVDENCDGLLDEPGAEGCVYYYEDLDKDGFGGSPYACLCQPAGAYNTPFTGDCDDQDPEVNPDAEELCTGEDEDCDGSINEEGAVGCEPWYEDNDDDGFGTDEWRCRCYGVRPYSTRETGDCNDEDPAVFPGAEEICGDETDSDCDGLGLECVFDLSEAGAMLVGEENMDYAGYAVAAGDVDGDGLDEILVGAPYEDKGGSNAGAAYLVQGPPTGEVDLSDASAKLVGVGDDDHAGMSLAAGDFDGDGLDDVLVGAPDEDSGGAGAGVAYLLRGPVSGAWSLSVASAKLVGESAGDGAARWLAAADIGGDGIEDILVGAPGYDADGEDRGTVYGVHGPASGTIRLSAADVRFAGEEAGDQAGWVIATGDIDGDGVLDVLVGAPSHDAGGADAGAAYLVASPASGSFGLDLADAKFVGEEPGDGAGSSLAMGDLDGDGLEDVLIGAPQLDAGGSEAGGAYVVLAPASGVMDLSEADARLLGEDTGDAAGWSLEVADLDEDGVADLLVAAYYESTGGLAAGATYLVCGPVAGAVDLSMAAMKLVGEDASNWAGGSLALGNIDGGGVPDLLVGAFGQDAGGAYAGAVYVVFGEGI